MRRCRTSLAILLSLLAAPALVRGQTPDTVPAVRADPTPRMFAGGLIGAMVGGLAGAVVGVSLEAASAPECGDWCGVSGAVFGFLAGETLGLSAGVHLGNDRQGSFALTALAAGTVFAGGLLLAESLPGGVLMIAIPVAQLITATEVQRRTARQP